MQAYAGNAGADGVSHSFVELYNNTDKEIDLNGITLQYAGGTSDSAIKEVDDEWAVIELEGKIPAKGSYLILGPKQSAAARYQIPDGYGDIQLSDTFLNSRAFKAAIIHGTKTLAVQNPFDIDGKGGKVEGYIDMVGAANDYPKTDMIHGFETNPAKCSASESVRRATLTDTNDNSADFITTRYSATGEDAFTDEEIKVRRPRNSKAGAWDPFAAPASYTKLKLNEVSGVGNDPDKFYELINTGDKNIPLYNCKIYYNANGSTGGTLPTGKGNLTWTGLTSQTIEAGKLFSLIGRDNPSGTKPGSFTTGLTAARILIITLEDPEGNVIDTCVRTKDTGEYNISDKSYSRIPDGTGDFYFTAPTPNTTNGTSTAGLTKLPDEK